MYTSEIINAFGLNDFSDYIPVNYYSQIELGELDAKAVYEENGEDREFIGVTVTADHSGWLEIVWVSVNKAKYNVVLASNLIKYLIREARISKEYKGAFCEIHKAEETAVHLDILTLAGLSVTETKNNIYEIELKDIPEAMTKAPIPKGSACIPINEATEDLLGEIDMLMANDERPIPTPYEIDYEICDKELSLVCVENDAPTGFMYLVPEKDYLVLELAYSASKTALPVMISEVLKKALAKYGPSQKVLIPIVGKSTKDIVTRLIPNAERGDIVQAVVRFDKPDIPPVMDMILKRILTK